MNWNMQIPQSSFCKGQILTNVNLNKISRTVWFIFSVVAAVASCVCLALCLWMVSRVLTLHVQTPGGDWCCGHWRSIPAADWLVCSSSLHSGCGECLNALRKQTDCACVCTARPRFLDFIFYFVVVRCRKWNQADHMQTCFGSLGFSVTACCTTTLRIWTLSCVSSDDSTMHTCSSKSMYAKTTWKKKRCCDASNALEEIRSWSEQMWLVFCRSKKRNSLFSLLRYCNLLILFGRWFTSLQTTEMSLPPKRK